MNAPPFTKGDLVVHDYVAMGPVRVVRCYMRECPVPSPHPQAQWAVEHEANDHGQTWTWAADMRKVDR